MTEKEYVAKMFEEYQEIRELNTSGTIVLDDKNYVKLKSTLDILEMGGYIHSLNVDGGHLYVVDDSFDYFEENMRAEIGIQVPRIIELIKQIPDIKKRFTSSFASVKTIHRDKEFIKWKNEMLYELQSLKREEFIKEIETLLKSINNGWDDEKFFDELEAKLLILEKNINKYLTGTQETEMDKSMNNKKVFIVHGHDEKLKYEMANWLRSLDLEPIILHLTANMGIKTIIDKIQENSDVRCAIVLMTADDLGKAKAEEDLKPRARQNVIFEAGYFLGRLGEEHVILLYDNGLEAPGDLAGCIYIEADSYGGWKEQVRTEFKSMGIDYSR